VETAHTGVALLAIEDRDHGQFIGYCGLIVGRATWQEPEIALSYSAYITTVATPPKPVRRS
jgi:hypothetical protein